MQLSSVLEKIIPWFLIALQKYLREVNSVFLQQFFRIRGGPSGVPPKCLSGAPAGGGGRYPETEKIVVEKWFYFPQLYKMIMRLENRIQNRLKHQFSIEIFVWKIENFSNIEIIIGV